MNNKYSYYPSFLSKTIIYIYRMPTKVEVQNPQEPVQQAVKPKREITEAQRQHLNKIRQLAMEKKKQLKEITLKAKLAKTVPKEDLAKQYDEFVAKKVTQTPKTPELKPQKPKQQVKRFDNSESETDETIESEEEVILKKKVKKPVKKIKKKIVYESESESEEEQIVVRKKKHTQQKQPLEKLVYNNTKEQLYNRMIEERVHNSLAAYSHALGV
jgi:hypothetical protein